MITLINIAKKIGIENQSSIRVILSNYSMDKLFDTLPKVITDESNSEKYIFDLKIYNLVSYELRYIKNDKDSLFRLTGIDLRQVLINAIIEVIKLKLNFTKYRCNNEF